MAAGVGVGGIMSGTWPQDLPASMQTRPEGNSPDTDRQRGAGGRPQRKALREFQKCTEASMWGTAGHSRG